VGRTRAAGADAGTGYETDPRWLIARARYKTWLHEQASKGTPTPSTATPPPKSTTNGG
jgi:hypothetical protein